MAQPAGPPAADKVDSFITSACDRAGASPGGTGGEPKLAEEAVPLASSPEALSSDALSVTDADSSASASEAGMGVDLDPSGPVVATLS
ncbi:MAG: hypothetical protein GY772_09780 [bacterium]|nr:hypothetical protein [bacterium]